MIELTRSVLISAFVLFCVVAVSAQDKNSPVNVKYDKKNDQTTVRLKPFKISRLILEKEASNNTPLHQTDLEISFTHPGQQVTKPVENVVFKFMVSSSNYTFLRPQAAMAVLDSDAATGRAFALGNSEYKSLPPITNSVYQEVLTVSAPAEALVKMAKANALQIYLGPVAYSITPKQLDAIKALAEKLSPGAAADTTKS